MGYRIIYDGGSKKAGTGRILRCFLLTSLFFFCFLGLVRVCWPEGWTLIEALVIPGNPDRTWQALEVFSQQLSDRNSILDALRDLGQAMPEYGS